MQADITAPLKIILVKIEGKRGHVTVETSFIFLHCISLINEIYLADWFPLFKKFEPPSQQDPYMDIPRTVHWVTIRGIV